MQYEVIKKGVANRDVKALREAIGSICYTSRDFSSGEFDEAVRYVEERGIQLKDASLIGNPPVSSQKSSFTDEDFARAVFELQENFCDERIKDVKTIGSALYGAPKRQEAPASTPVRPAGNGTSPNAPSHQPQSSKGFLGLVAVIIVIIILTLFKWE